MKNQGYEKEMAAGRAFMQSNSATSGVVPDKDKGLPQPPVSKPPMMAQSIALPKDFDALPLEKDYLALLRSRRSTRLFADTPLPLLALSFLLWSTQGVEKLAGAKQNRTLRPVPSGGCRHAYETYLAVQNVEGLTPGVYHYLPLEHRLELLKALPDAQNAVSAALCGQTWASLAPVVFFWAAQPYRCEWLYGDKGHRYMMLDAGHIGQNFQLSATALGLASCNIAAYYQEECDGFLGLDGEEEFAVYAAAVGAPK